MNQENLINQQIKIAVASYIRKLHKKKLASSSFPYIQLLVFVFAYSLFIHSNNKSSAWLDMVSKIEQNCKSMIENQAVLLQLSFLKTIENFKGSIDQQLNQLASSHSRLSDEIKQVNASIPLPPITIKIEEDQVVLLMKKIILKFINARNNNLNYLTKDSVRLYDIQDYIHYLYTPQSELTPEISTIFSLDTFSLINKWIGYVGKYKLIFRASRDGYAGGDFYQKCHDYYPTIVIIKNNYGKIFGGYNPQAWSKPDPTLSWLLKSDFSKETFIFSISMKRKFALIDQMAAIMAHKDYGISFGGRGRLILGNMCNVTDSCTGDSMVNSFETAPVDEFVGRTDGVSFSVIDYEVFMIEN
jgi:hypothetical protein